MNPETKEFLCQIPLTELFSISKKASTDISEAEKIFEARRTISKLGFESSPGFPFPEEIHPDSPKLDFCIMLTENQFSNDFEGLNPGIPSPNCIFFGNFSNSLTKRLNRKKILVITL